MGNSLGQQLCFAPQEKTRVLFNGGEEEFEAWTAVKKITSGRFHGYNLVHHAQPFLPLPPKAKLEPGEVYCLVPNMVYGKRDGNASCGFRSIKVVVTKQQLEFLMRNRKKFQPKVVLRYVGKCRAKDGVQKWQPSLATIPE